jgi:hypothetical protein
MNCDRATEMFMAGLAGELQALDDRALATHLRACAACGTETARLAGLWIELGALPEAQPSATSRARFDRMLAEWQNTGPAAVPRVAPDEPRSWSARRRDWLATAIGPQPAARWAAAVALLACGFTGGSWIATRGGEMQALRQELESTRSMMVLSLLQQRSSADRLQGIGYSTHDGGPDPQVVTALFEALDHDTSVDVRLAAADAIAGLHPNAAVGARLVNSLRAQSSPLVQVALLDVLAKRHESDAQPLLQEMIANPRLNKSVRERAQWALRHLTL